jgi:hypothetical protein
MSKDATPQEKEFVFEAVTDHSCLIENKDLSDGESRWWELHGALPTYFMYDSDMKAALFVTNAFQIFNPPGAEVANNIKIGDIIVVHLLPKEEDEVLFQQTKSMWEDAMEVWKEWGLTFGLDSLDGHSWTVIQRKDFPNAGAVFAFQLKDE